MDDGSSSKDMNPTANPRGRPIKTDNQDPKVERRRTQVRLNQRHLRQRKQGAYETLQKKVQNMQGAVESVSEAFVTLNDALVNSGVAAEIVVPLKTTLDQVLRLAREAFDESEEFEGSAENSRAPLIHQPHQLARGQSQSPIGRSVPPALIIPPNVGLRDTVEQNLAANVAYQERARFSAVAQPSFATLLSFNTVLYGYRLLADDMVLNIEAARNMFSLRSRFESFHDIIDSMRKGLYFYLQCVQMPDCSFGNVIGVPMPSREELTATSIPFRDVSVEKYWVCQAIEANLSHTDPSKEQFMDPRAVERYLKENWVLQLDGHSVLPHSLGQQSDPSLQRPSQAGVNDPVDSQASARSEHRRASVAGGDIDSVSPRMNDDSGNSTNTLVVDRTRSVQRFSHLIHDNDVHILVQRLVKASVCFGSEPRWSKEVVDSVVGGFIRDRRAHRAKMADSLSSGSVWFTLRFAH